LCFETLLECLRSPRSVTIFSTVLLLATFFMLCLNYVLPAY